MSASKKDILRAPPCYQMYASDRLANLKFRTMSLQERGILHTMEMECWVNGSLPVDMPALARILGLSEDEIQAALTNRVLMHFERREDPEPSYICIELEGYRQKLMARRASQVAGGVKGALKRRLNAEYHGSPSGLPNGLPTRSPNRLASRLPSGLPGRLPDGSLSRAEQSGVEVSGDEENRKSVYSEEEIETFRREMDGPAPFEVIRGKRH